MATDTPLDLAAQREVMSYATKLPFLARCGYELSECVPGDAVGSVTVVAPRALARVRARLRCISSSVRSRTRCSSASSSAAASVMSV